MKKVVIPELVLQYISEFSLKESEELAMYQAGVRYCAYGESIKSVKAKSAAKRKTEPRDMQLWFDFNAPEKVREPEKAPNLPPPAIKRRKAAKAGKQVNYVGLYHLLQEKDLSIREIREFTGLGVNDVGRVITTMSLEYPLWCPKKSVYSLLNWRKAS